MAETNTPNLDLLLVEKGDYYNYIKQHKENYVKIDTAVGEKQDTLNKNIRVTDDFNNYVDDGNYAVVMSDISSILNYPADLKGNIAYGYGCLTVKKYYEGNYVVQTYRSNANYNNNIFERIMYNGVWKSWAATYTERSKPAPSDIGALASGDVSEDYNTAEKIEDKIESLSFEYGSNQYGFYRKWSNGSLECFPTNAIVTSISANSNSTGTFIFPFEFIETPNINGIYKGTNTGVNIIIYDTTDNTKFVYKKSTTLTAEGGVYWSAIGRWK